MFNAPILKTFLILNLLGLPVAAQQSGDVRFPLGLALIEPSGASLSAETLGETAARSFASIDGDGDGRIDVGELKAWRGAQVVRKGEVALESLLKLDPERLLQGADHDGDKAISLPEFRALTLYDFSVNDADGSNALTPEEIEGLQPAIVSWAARPCLEFGMAEGMLLGAFCAR